MRDGRRGVPGGVPVADKVHNPACARAPGLVRHADGAACRTRDAFANGGTAVSDLVSAQLGRGAVCVRRAGRTRVGGGGAGVDLPAAGSVGFLKADTGRPRRSSRPSTWCSAWREPVHTLPPGRPGGASSRRRLQAAGRHPAWGTRWAPSCRRRWPTGYTHPRGPSRHSRTAR